MKKVGNLVYRRAEQDATKVHLRQQWCRGLERRRLTSGAAVVVPQTLSDFALFDDVVHRLQLHAHIQIFIPRLCDDAQVCMFRGMCDEAWWGYKPPRDERPVRFDRLIPERILLASVHWAVAKPHHHTKTCPSKGKAQSGGRSPTL